MKKHFIIFVIIFIILATVFVSYSIYCENTIKIRNYKLTTEKLDTKIHFVLISDLHEKEFGENNKELIEKIKNQSPDFIAFSGDMISRDCDDLTVMKSLLKELVKIAPTYCVLGNHERENYFDFDFKTEINSTGAVLLDNAYVRFRKNGESFLIGGLSDYPYYDRYAPDYDIPERYFWDEFNEMSKDNYTILLHHQPEYISKDAQTSGVDLIVCGHTHGGQFQIPFIGGLVAPNQGPFPKYDVGEFDFEHTKMIISAGLGNPVSVPRLNNCPDITVIDIN